MFRWIYRRWYRRLRQIDIDILWPILKRDALSLAHARAAFCLHAFEDHAWSDLTKQEIEMIVGQPE